METDRGPGFEALLMIVAESMSERLNIVDVPLAESIADDIIAATGGNDHVVMIDENGTWTLRHPITERFVSKDALFSCPWAYAMNGLVWYHSEPGRYVMSRLETGKYVMEKEA